VEVTDSQLLAKVADLLEVKRDDLDLALAKRAIASANEVELIIMKHFNKLMTRLFTEIIM